MLQHLVSKVTTEGWNV